MTKMLLYSVGQHRNQTPPGAIDEVCRNWRAPGMECHSDGPFGCGPIAGNISSNVEKHTTVHTNDPTRTRTNSTNAVNSGWKSGQCRRKNSQNIQPITHKSRLICRQTTQTSPVCLLTELIDFDAFEWIRHSPVKQQTNQSQSIKIFGATWAFGLAKSFPTSSPLHSGSGLF